MNHAERAAYAREWRHRQGDKYKSYCRERRAKEPERHIWQGMITRCENHNNSAYKDYGGRGIRVCKEWRYDFHAFLAHIGRRPAKDMTLDRIDNNGHYGPGNVRWASRKTQALNRRRTRVHCFEGIRDSLRGWAARFGLPQAELLERMDSGLGFIECLLTPIGSFTGKLSVLHIPLADLLGEVARPFGMPLDGERR